jgi:hypothetical protein
MSSKYIPPFLRNKKESAKVSPIVEEIQSVQDTFPNLTSKPVVQVSSQRLGKSFANLASDWANEADRQKEEDRLKDNYRVILEDGHRYSSISLPKFHNVRHFVEPEDAEEDNKPTTVSSDESGWIEVRRKKKERRPKTFEERLDEDEENVDESKNEETVWNTEDDETYWK